MRLRTRPRQDIGEQQNLAATQPNRAKDLQARLVAWRKAIQAPMPTPNQPETAAKKTTRKQKQKQP